MIAVPGSSRADSSGSDEDSEGRRTPPADVIGRHRTSPDVIGRHRTSQTQCRAGEGGSCAVRRTIGGWVPVGPPGNRSDVFQDGFGLAVPFPNVPVAQGGERAGPLGDIGERRIVSQILATRYRYHVQSSVCAGRPCTWRDARRHELALQGRVGAG